MPPKEPPTPPPTFMTGLPDWAKIFVQLGFAAVVAVLFVTDSRDRSNQLRNFYEETRNQSRDDRTLFREELRLQREELKSAVSEMRRAVDRLDANQRVLKTEIEDVKNPFPAPRAKPPTP